MAAIRALSGGQQVRESVSKCKYVCMYACVSQGVHLSVSDCVGQSGYASVSAFSVSAGMSR